MSGAATNGRVFGTQNSKLRTSSLDLSQLTHPAVVVPAHATGFARLDQLLNGGLPAGRLTELHGPMTGGKMSLLLRMLTRELQEGRRAAFIDLPGMFYPCNLPEKKLLVARPKDWKRALRAADVLISSREWSLIIVDLSGHVQSIPPESCNRLARGARDTNTTVIFLHDHPHRTLGSLITLRLKVNRKLTENGRALEVYVAKNKLAAPGRTVTLALQPDPSMADDKWKMADSDADQNQYQIPIKGNKTLPQSHDDR